MLLNRYDAAKILLLLETAPIKQYPDQRVIALDVDSICDYAYADGIDPEIELYFGFTLNEMADIDLRLLAADVLKDISEIDKQWIVRDGMFIPNVEDQVLADFQFQSNDDVEVGYVDASCGSSYGFPLKKEGSTWCIDWLKYNHRRHRPS